MRVKGLLGSTHHRPWNGSKGETLPAMAAAMVAAEKTRRSDVSTTAKKALIATVAHAYTGWVVCLTDEAADHLGNSSLMLECRDRGDHMIFSVYRSSNPSRGSHVGSHCKRADSLLGDKTRMVSCGEKGVAVLGADRYRFFRKQAGDCRLTEDGLVITLDRTRMQDPIRRGKAGGRVAQAAPEPVKEEPRDRPLEQARMRDLVREVNSRVSEDDTLTLEVRDGQLVALAEYR